MAFFGMELDSILHPRLFGHAHLFLTSEGDAQPTLLTTFSLARGALT